MDDASRAQEYSTAALFAAADSGGWRGPDGAIAAPAGAERDFLTQIARDSDAEDMAGLTAAGLVALANEFWLWSATSEKTQTARIRDAAGRSILEVAGPDMPFLVDSVMGDVVEQGLSVRALFHPIVDRGRGRESLIQVHLPALTPARAGALLDGVRATLADVASAVGDFQAMTARMRACGAALAEARGPDEATRSEAAPEYRAAIESYYKAIAAKAKR